MGSNFENNLDQYSTEGAFEVADLINWPAKGDPKSLMNAKIASTRPSLTRITSAAATISLSATGSRNAPKADV